MVKNGRKRSKMVKNGQKWSKWPEKVKNGHIIVTSIFKIYASNGEVGGSNGEVRR